MKITDKGKNFLKMLSLFSCKGLYPFFYMSFDKEKGIGCAVNSSTTSFVKMVYKPTIEEGGEFWSDQIDLSKRLPKVTGDVTLEFDGVKIKYNAKKRRGSMLSIAKTDEKKEGPYDKWMKYKDKKFFSMEPSLDSTSSSYDSLRYMITIEVKDFLDIVSQKNSRLNPSDYKIKVDDRGKVELQVFSIDNEGNEKEDIDYDSLTIGEIELLEEDKEGFETRYRIGIDDIISTIKSGEGKMFFGPQSFLYLCFEIEPPTKEKQKTLDGEKTWLDVRYITSPIEKDDKQEEDEEEEDDFSDDFDDV